jgi:hypothetical protein
MRHGETYDFVRLFRDRHLQSGGFSADWNREWLDFVRQLIAELRPEQQSEEK